MIRIILNCFNKLREALYHYKASLLIMIAFILIQPIFGQVKPPVDSLTAHSKYAPAKKVADSVIIRKHSPRKATYLSFICPGLGQAYNKKYWKLPIVYAGFGVMGYFFIANHSEYVKFRNAYNFVTTPHMSASITSSTQYGDAYGVVSTPGNPKFPPVNDYVTRYRRDPTLLLAGRDYYRRNLELTYIVTGVWYVLVAIDAQVDAQFFNFDVSDDLTLNVKPFVQPRSNFTPAATGVTLCFSF
jgi:hypothetical protein